jgi:protein phosphatase
MKFCITAASEVGCVRHKNEDMVLVDRRFVRNNDCKVEIGRDDADRFIIAIADGMGGHNSGEVASHDVLHNLEYYYHDLPSGLKPGDFNEMIFEWLESINNIIDSKGHSDPQYHDMGTTLVAFAFYGNEFYWMNCGDSRIYQYIGGQLTQISTDHSLSNLMGSSKHSNIITNCIGGGCKTSYLDMVKFADSVIQSSSTFLLCSDGLTDMLTDKQIEQLLAEGKDASELCAAAVDAGGFDNVSVCIIKTE